MIVISPYAKKLLSGNENPKNYPYWVELVYELSKTNQIVQIGIAGEDQICDDFRKDLTIDQLKDLLLQCKTWISCDSFIQHLAWSIGKPGIVLWSVSDPLIFGHPENINLLKSRGNLAKNQFHWWDLTPHDPKKFVNPEEVLKCI